MKPIIDVQHKSFFKAKGFLGLEDVFSSGQMQEKLQKVYREKIFPTAFDKNIFSSWLLKIVAELAGERSFKLGHIFKLSNETLAHPFFRSEILLETLCCVQDVSCGILVALQNDPLSLAHSADLETPNDLPLKVEDALIVSNYYHLPLQAIKNTEFQYLLFTLCRTNARYIQKPNHPYSNIAKEEHQGYGDLISPDFHPRFDAGLIG